MTNATDFDATKALASILLSRGLADTDPAFALLDTIVKEREVLKVSAEESQQEIVKEIEERIRNLELLTTGETPCANLIRREYLA